MQGMDWKKLINQLIADSMTQARIAAACGCSQATISDIQSGKNTDPRFSIGDSLRKLATRKRQPEKALA